jgi:hypothetical protein
MQNGVQQRIMNLYLSIVADESEFAELVHEVAHPGPSCADHFRQRFLADSGIDWHRVALLSEMREQKEKARESLLT